MSLVSAPLGTQASVLPQMGDPVTELLAKDAAVPTLPPTLPPCTCQMRSATSEPECSGDASPWQVRSVTSQSLEALTACAVAPQAPPGLNHLPSPLLPPPHLSSPSPPHAWQSAEETALRAENAQLQAPPSLSLPAATGRGLTPPLRHPLPRRRDPVGALLTLPLVEGGGSHGSPPSRK
jgi:hypothetical protein